MLDCSFGVPVQQAAAARQRASARQQAKRAQNKSTSEQDEDAGELYEYLSQLPFEPSREKSPTRIQTAGSDSGAEDDGQEDGEELDEDAMVPATATKGKSGETPALDR